MFIPDFLPMSTTIETTYTYETECTWFQTLSAPLEMSFTFGTVCIWFLTMSTTSETTYTFRTVCTRFQTLSTPFRNILHLPDCLYLVPNHVYSIWKPTAYMPYTFLNVSFWFQSLSAHLVMSNIFVRVDGDPLKLFLPNNLVSWKEAIVENHLFHVFKKWRKNPESL